MTKRKGNVVEFPRQKLPPRGEKDLSYEAYEKVVRVEITGDVHDADFLSWIVEVGNTLNLVGWVRERQGQGRMDALLAGTRDSVADMVDMVEHGAKARAVPAKGACPIAAPDVTERPLRGDEPLWSGFHRLPPV